MNDEKLKQLRRNPCPFCHAEAGEPCRTVMKRFGPSREHLSPMYLHSSRRSLNNHGNGEKLKIAHLPWPMGRSPGVTPFTKIPVVFD